MTMQTLCDGCGQTIDVSESFYLVQIQTTQQAPLTVPAGGFPPPPVVGVPEMRRFDFHQSCLPSDLGQREPEDEG